jgi:hypothetical protein
MEVSDLLEECCLGLGRTLLDHSFPLSHRRDHDRAEERQAERANCDNRMPRRVLREPLLKD